jgi:hypothetical protein
MLSIAIACVIVSAFAWNATVSSFWLATAGTGGTVCIAVSCILLSEYNAEADLHLIVSVAGWTVLAMVLSGVIRKYVIRFGQANPG